MIIEFRDLGSKRRGWGRISGVDVDGARAWLATEYPGKDFELRIKRGRPDGYRKPNAASGRVAIRLTTEQSAKLAGVPGETLSAKLRHLIERAPICD